MAATTYDKKPAFLVKELDKILREARQPDRGAKVEDKVPVVRVTGEGRVKVVIPSTRGGTSKR